MKQIIKIEIPIEPLPQPRARVTRKGTYQPAKIVKYKTAIKQAAMEKMKGSEPTEQAVKCIIKVYRKYKVTSRRYGDLDNLYKAITDALNGVVYKDDSQIIKCVIEKYQSAEMKIEIEIEAA